MRPAIAAVALIVIWPGTAAGNGWTAREIGLVRSLALTELPPPPASPSNRVADNSEAATLGRALFFDPRFSQDGSVSCATCHDPERQFQDGLPQARGIGTTTRRTMPIAGAAYNPFLFWDGRVDSLWSQALVPMEHSYEHGGDRTLYSHLIAENYRAPYEAVFGQMPPLAHLPPTAGPVPDPTASSAWAAMEKHDREAVTEIFVNIGKSIAAFERTIPPLATRFDAWVESAAFPEPGLLNEQEIRGLRIFVGVAACINCHNGPLFTNHTFHNTGVPPGPVPDFGRAKGARMVVLNAFNCRGRYSDAGERGCPELRYMSVSGHVAEGAFKTPGLRGVAQRPPYMHAGQLTSLRAVVEHYSAAPPAVVGHNELKPLRLSEPEKAALLAFLATLNP